MAKKSADFTVHFYYPTTEEGKKTLAEAIGEIHTKFIQELLDKMEFDISLKNKVISEVQKKLIQKSNGIKENKG